MHVPDRGVNTVGEVAQDLHTVSWELSSRRAICVATLHKKL